MSKHTKMGYGITTLKLRFAVDDLIDWLVSQIVTDGTIEIDTVAVDDLLGKDDSDWVDSDYWHDDVDDESFTYTDLMIESDGTVRIDGDIQRRQYMSRSLQADLVDVVHSWMVDALEKGLAPMDPAFRESVRFYTNLCDYHRRITGYWTTAEGGSRVSRPQPGTYVEVEWYTDAEDDVQAEAQAEVNRNTTKATKAMVKNQSSKRLAWVCVSCNYMHVMDGSADWKEHQYRVCLECNTEHHLIERAEYTNTGSERYEGARKITTPVVVWIPPAEFQNEHFGI